MYGVDVCRRFLTPYWKQFVRLATSILSVNSQTFYNTEYMRGICDCHVQRIHFIYGKGNCMECIKNFKLVTMYF